MDSKKRLGRSDPAISMNTERISILISRAEHLLERIYAIQADAAIVHESNKYAGGLTSWLHDFASSEALQELIARERQWRKGYSEEDATRDFEFRIERAEIAIVNYINHGEFNCGYWHPLKGK
jgi:hypothetical protein